MQSASNITNLNEYEDVVDKITVIDSNISTLQSYTVSKRKKLWRWSRCIARTHYWRSEYCYWEWGWQRTLYGVTTGRRNVMVGYNSGGTCITGSNNT